MSDADISTAAVERLLDGVTAGPWHDFGGESSAISSEYGLPVAFYVSRANRPFIAASRDLVPALLADRDRLAAEVARLKAERDAAIAAPAPQAREITVQEAAGALLDKDGRADAKLVDIADEIYAAGGSMSRAIGVALRTLAAMQKGG